MLAIYVGYLLDMIFGDPYSIPHPVRWIGKLIETLERSFRKFRLTSRGLSLAGSLLVVLVVGISFIIPYLILFASYKLHYVFGLLIETIMIFQILATCSLGKEAEKVFDKLKNNDLIGARDQISFLVSRDTSVMSEEDICKATIETVSENFADGVIAPMLFIVLGGASLGWAYKAVNTLDSMVGYKNDKYIDFGKSAAIFDDIINWVPARISVIFIWLASFVMKFNTPDSIKMVKRDHDKHSSPNSAWPESAFAGALEIQLGGKASYFGKTENKPTMGDAINAVTKNEIKKSIKLMYVSSFVGLIVLSGLRMLLVAALKTL